MATSFEPAVAGQVAQTLGPMFALPITAPEAVDRFAAIGFDRDEWAERYFAFRSAQLGRATAETVIATYFNFAPRRIQRYIPRVWDIADPEVVLDTLMDAVDASTGRTLVDFADAPELRELANLLSAAAASAFEHPEGRPLFAGIAGIPWPEAPNAQIWLAMHALREFRGDGHVAVLTASGLTGIEALVLHAGMGLFPPDLLRSSRAWPQEMWDQTIEELRGRGLLAPDELRLSEVGELYRGQIETQTDELTVPAYEQIGQAGAERILELAPPIVAAVTSGFGRISRESLSRATTEEA
jgi:hypothetical protein